MRSRFDVAPLVARFAETRGADLQRLLDESIALARRLDAAGKLDSAAMERVVADFAVAMNRMVQANSDEVLLPALAVALADRELIAEAVERGRQDGATREEVACGLVDAAIVATLAELKARR